MTNIRRLHELPLLGSNQDSPDPESASVRRDLGKGGLKAPHSQRVSTSSPTISHTVFHAAGNRSVAPQPLGESDEKRARQLLAARDTSDPIALLELLGQALRSMDSARRQRSSLRAAIGMITVDVAGRCHYVTERDPPLVPMPETLDAALRHLLAGVRRPRRDPSPQAYLEGQAMRGTTQLETSNA